MTFNSNFRKSTTVRQIWVETINLSRNHSQCWACMSEINHKHSFAGVSTYIILELQTCRDRWCYAPWPVYSTRLHWVKTVCCTTLNRTDKGVGILQLIVLPSMYWWRFFCVSVISGNGQVVVSVSATWRTAVSLPMLHTWGVTSPPYLNFNDRYKPCKRKAGFAKQGFHPEIWWADASGIKITYTYL